MKNSNESLDAFVKDLVYIKVQLKYITGMQIVNGDVHSRGRF